MIENKSINVQLREIFERCLKEASDVLIRMQEIEDDRVAEQSAWLEKEAAWRAKENLLITAARSAEQREAKSQDQLEWERHRHANELQSAGDEISRLRGLIDIGLGAFTQAQEGVAVAQRLREGVPAFEPSVARSNAVPGAHQGEPYQSVTADIEESLTRIAAMGNRPTTLPPAFIKAMEDDMEELAKVAKG